MPDERPVLVFVGESAARVWNDTADARLRKAFAKKGITETQPLEAVSKGTAPAVLLRRDAVLDAPVVEALAMRSGVALKESDGDRVIAAHVPPEAVEATACFLLGESDAAPSGVTVATPTTLGSEYWKALRKREAPYA